MSHDLWGRVEALMLNRPGFKFWISNSQVVWSWIRFISTWCLFSHLWRWCVNLPGGVVLRTDWIDECKVPTLCRGSVNSRCGYCLFSHSLYSLTICPNHAFLFCSEIMHFYPWLSVSSHWNAGSHWGMEYYDQNFISSGILCPCEHW